MAEDKVIFHAQSTHLLLGISNEAVITITPLFLSTTTEVGTYHTVQASVSKKAVNYSCRALWRKARAQTGSKP
jgi:hypothetical protein